MNNEDKRLRSLRSAARLSLICALALIAVTIGLFIIEREANAALFGSIAITVLFAGFAIYCNIYYRRKLRESKSDDTDASIRTVSSIAKGKDMYEVCRTFRLLSQKNVWIILAIGILATSAAITIKTHDIKPDLPWWIFFPVMAGVSLLMIIFGRGAFREDMSFKRPEDLKLEIAKRQEDPIRVNTDFMSGRAYSLFKGMMVIGMSYYIVYSKKTCYLGLLSKVSSAHITKHEIKKPSSNPVANRYWVTTVEEGKEQHFLAGSETEAELIIDEFRKHGIEITKTIES